MELKGKQKVVLFSVFLTASMLSCIDRMIRRYSLREASTVPPDELEPVTIEACVGVEEPSDENVRCVI